MRILLATFSFVVAALALGYFGLCAYELTEYFMEQGLDGWESEVTFALAIAGASFLIGIIFVVAGLAVLSGKKRREQ